MDDKNFDQLIALAKQYMDESNVNCNFNTALELLQKNATKNNKEIYFYMGLCYDKLGEFNKLNYKKAFKYYKLACDKNNYKPYIPLAALYRFGKISKINMKEAIRLYKIAADHDVKEANGILGELYLDGKEIQSDYKKALDYFKKSVDCNDDKGFNGLGCMNYYGLGITKDYKKALDYFKIGDELGNLNSTTMLGVIYRFGNGLNCDYKTAYEYFLKAADKGYYLAQKHLGDFYANGIYVEQDLIEAIKWYQMAASQNDSDAMIKIANLYALDDTLINDDEKAVHYYREAIKLGNASAMVNLGYLYETGDGVKKDYTEALKLYKESSRKNDKEGLCNLGNAYENGLGTDKDYKEALKCYRKAVRLGSVRAKCEIGELYENGRGVKQSYKEAIKWYKKAANSKYSIALFHIGNIYEYGRDCDIDYKEALKWYKKADENGYLPATYCCGYFYQKGLGLDENPEKANEYFKKGADKNNKDCLFALGRAYEYGLGVDKNLRTSIEYYYKARDYGYEDCNEYIERLKKSLAKDFLHLVSRKDVFISWNHNDKVIKDELVNYLENNDICTVWDSDGSGVGNINDIIKDAIIGAKSYIILVSGNSLQSEWVEKEVSMIFDVIDSHPDYENTIIPVLLNTKVVNNKIINFNTLEAINQLDDNSILKRLLTLSTSFTTKNNKIDYKSLIKQINQSIDSRLKIEYKYKIKNKFSTFNAALTKVVRNNNMTSNIISATIDFNEGYINRPVYNNRQEKVEISELIQNKYSLIHGAGGSGKTLYLQNIIRNYFTNDNFILYVPCKEINKNLTVNDKKVNFFDLLKKIGFEYYYPDGETLSNDSFNSIFNNNVLILIDALDELNYDLRSTFNAKLEQFTASYAINDNVRFVFTSRDCFDSNEIAKHVNNEVKTFELKGLEESDINKIFENISNKVRKSNDAMNSNTVSMPSKSQFIISLKNLSKDISRNPLLLSNLIYVYIVTRKIPDKQFTIIQKTNELLVKTLEEERDLSFKYYDYIEGNRLNDLLGNLSFKRSCNNNKSSIEIFKSYLENEKLIRNNDDSLVVAESIYKFLTRRSIIVRDNIAHEIFRDYYSACYIYKKSFVIKETDTGDNYLDFIISEKTGLPVFNNFLMKKLSMNDMPWTSIATDLLTKVDYEIYNFNTKANMDPNNDNYEFYAEFLGKIFNDDGYSKSSKKLIKDLAEKRLLYFYDFIKKYID